MKYFLLSSETKFFERHIPIYVYICVPKYNLIMWDLITKNVIV